MNEFKYISTDNLTAIIAEEDYIKVIIYTKIKSPYGYTKREMRYAPFGIKKEDFNYDYVKEAVDEVFNTFPDTQIKELIKKVNKYYDKIKE